MRIRKSIILLLLLLLLSTSPAALVFHSGFETGDASEWPDARGPNFVQVAGPHTGTYHGLCETNGAIFDAGLGTSVKRASVWMNLLQNTFAENSILGEEVALGLNVRVTIDEKLQLKENVTDKGTGDTVLSVGAGNWHRISLSINGTNAKLFINGVEELSVTITNGCHIPSQIGKFTASASGQFRFDDIAFDDSESSADLGDIRVQVALPIANGNQNDFDQTSGFGFCNNLPDDTDYVENNQSGTNREQFGVSTMTQLGISGDTPQAINVIIRQDRDGGGGTTHAINVRDNATDFETATAGTAAWTQYSKYYATLPSGGGAWSEARFDALEAGTYHAGPQDQRCSTVNVMLAYTPAAAPPTVGCQVIIVNMN